MASRRKFLHGTGAAALLALAPLPAWSSKQQIPTRLIPGTDESLPVIGLGNSRAFMSGDRQASSQVLNTFLRTMARRIDLFWVIIFQDKIRTSCDSK